MVFGLFKKKPSDWKGEGEYEKMWEGKEKRLEKTAKRLEKEDDIFFLDDGFRNLRIDLSGLCYYWTHIWYFPHNNYVNL